MYLDETAKEAAKAVQEIAKTATTALELAGKAGAFVTKVVGGPAEQIGELFADRIRLFKYQNLCAVADKVEVIHRKRKIEGKTLDIPPRLAIPMLESAALENNEALQDVWARLIANGTDPQFKEALHPGFFEAVKQLLPDEVIILNSFQKIKAFPFIFSCKISSVDTEKTDSGHAGKYSTGESWMLERHRGAYKQIYNMYLAYCGGLVLQNKNYSKVYIDNLLRLRVVELGYNFYVNEKMRQVSSRLFDNFHPTSEFVNVSELEREEYLRITPFGQSLLLACIADSV